MSAIRLFMRSMPLVALPAILLGCSGEPPLAQPPPVEVVVSHPVSQNIVDWDTYTGTVQARETVEVRARVNGHVKEVRFREGEEIAEGAELFILDSEPFKAELKKAEGEKATWEARLKLAEEKIAFYKPLADKGSVAKEELLKVLADKGEALGGIDVSKGKILDAELNIGYCKINASIAGKVGEALLTKADLVNASGSDSLLTTVVAVDPMYFYCNINQSAYQRYRDQLQERVKKDPAAAKKGMPKIPVELMIKGDDRHRYKGFVDFVDNRVDPNTSSIKARARFENPKGADGRRPLTAGLFARVRITLAEPTPALLVANRAILTDQSLKYVLVVNKAKGNVVERVDISASDRLQESGLRAVQAGLKGDEWVIIEGVNRARPGVIVDPKEEKMPLRPVVTK